MIPNCYFLGVIDYKIDCPYLGNPKIDLSPLNILYLKSDAELTHFYLIHDVANGVIINLGLQKCSGQLQDLGFL